MNCFAICQNLTCVLSEKDLMILVKKDRDDWTFFNLNRCALIEVASFIVENYIE